MAVFPLRAEWRFAITTAMEQSAMISGTLLMLELCADNLDLIMEVCVLRVYTSVYRKIAFVPLRQGYCTYIAPYVLRHKDSPQFDTRLSIKISLCNRQKGRVHSC